MEPQLALIEQSFDSRYSRLVREALDELPDNFTITDPCICGHPIVFASPGFLKMSGYSREEVIGRNGRIFQGPATDRRSVMEIREAIREERQIQVSLLNYRKDGTPLWMLFHMSPVFDRVDGTVTNFVAVQVPISRRWRRSCSANGRNGVNLCEEVGGGLRDAVLGSCRREVCSDSLAELCHVSAFGSVLDSDSRGVEAEEPCEASDSEKRRAASAISHIMSVLTHYSESTGRLVCGKRCFYPGSSLLSSSVIISLGRIKQSFVLTDVHLPDMPIVYASDAFLKLTGYSRHEVLGRNCRFLNGIDTDSSTLFQIKECIRIRQPCTVRILNYRKDGNSFWNLLHISPVRNAAGKAVIRSKWVMSTLRDGVWLYDEPHRFLLLLCTENIVDIEEDCENQGGDALSPEMRQRSTVGAVKVALRTLSMGAGSSRS